VWDGKALDVVVVVVVVVVVGNWYASTQLISTFLMAQTMEHDAVVQMNRAGGSQSNYSC
jgi:ethanolamine transporter EutH